MAEKKIFYLIFINFFLALDGQSVPISFGRLPRQTISKFVPQPPKRQVPEVSQTPSQLHPHHLSAFSFGPDLFRNFLNQKQPGQSGLGNAFARFGAPYFVPVPIVLPPPPAPPQGPQCYTNPSGFLCCNATLEQTMIDTFKKLRKNPRYTLCNVQKIAAEIQKVAERKFKTKFESVAAHKDFAAKSHFSGDLNCKIEIEGKYLLAYATPVATPDDSDVTIIDANNFFGGGGGLSEVDMEKIKKQLSTHTTLGNETGGPGVSTGGGGKPTFLIYAHTTADSESESVIEEFPMVTIEDDSDEPIPGPSTARLPIICDNFEKDKSEDDESDIVVIKVKSKNPRNFVAEQEVISVDVVSDQATGGFKQKSMRSRYNSATSSRNFTKSDGNPSSFGRSYIESSQKSIEVRQKSTKSRQSLEGRSFPVSSQNPTGLFPNFSESHQNTPISREASTESNQGIDLFPVENTRKSDYRSICGQEKMDGFFNVVHRRWKNACLIYPNPLLPQEPYLDSLSGWIANSMKSFFRGLHVVNTLPPGGMTNERIFRLISYNVLCQWSMDNNPYLYEHLEHFNQGVGGSQIWAERWKPLKNELQSLKGDIYCLQEVECEVYNDCFLALFNSMGFYGIYTQREGRADGCSIFWRTSKFTLIEKLELNLNYDVEGLDKPNVAQIIVLKHNFTKKELVIVNTHILFAPGRGDIKLNQLVVIFSQLKLIRKQNQHVIFAGDLNIEPHSLLYNFIRYGSIEIRPGLRPLFRGYLSGQKCGSSKGRLVDSFLIPEVTNVNFDCSMRTENSESRNSVYKITHPFRFSNVYDHVTNSGQNEVSTYHKDVGNPDHIFYTVEKVINNRNSTFDVRERGLHLIRRLTLPDIQMFQELSGPLPNSAAGSDHIPLLADFSIF